MRAPNYTTVDELIVTLQALSAKGYGHAHIGVALEYGITRDEPAISTHSYDGKKLLDTPWIEFEGLA